MWAKRALQLLPFGLVLVLYVSVQASPRSLWSEAAWGKQRGTGACEPKQLGSAVREPINAWSNILYGALGTWALSSAYSDLRAPPQKPAVDAGHIRAAPEISVLFSLSWLALSACSFLWHAANVRGWQHADVGTTFAATLCLTTWSLCSFLLTHVPACRRRPRLTRGVILLLTSVADALFIIFKWELRLTNYMIGAISVLIAIEVALQPVFARKTWRQRILVWVAVLQVGAAYALREAESSKKFFGARKPLCIHSPWFQPHALWHIFTAGAIGCLYLSWRLPNPPNCVRERPCAGVAPSESRERGEA